RVGHAQHGLVFRINPRRRTGAEWRIRCPSWPSCAEIGRVIFMSTPHRGSDLAKNWIGRIGSMLVRTPTRLLTVGRTLRTALTADPAALRLKRFPNSVDTRAPNQRFGLEIKNVQ